MRFDRNRLVPLVEHELATATALIDAGRPAAAFAHFERAHVLGQFDTRLHVRTHWRMLCHGAARRDPREVAGQLLRLLGAATMTAFGWLPHGNTGGANVSAFQPMPVPDELQRLLDATRLP